MNPLSQTAPRLTWLAGAFVVSFCALLGVDRRRRALAGRARRRDRRARPDSRRRSLRGRSLGGLGERTGARRARVPRARGRARRPRAPARARRRRVRAVAIATLALDMRRADAADAPSALVLLLVAVAAAQSLLIVRGQLFSLALFPVVLLILRNQARLPSRGRSGCCRRSSLSGRTSTAACSWGSPLPARICCSTAAADAGERPSPCSSRRSAAVLATPSLLDTRHYYQGVLGSEAAAGHEGLWAPLSFDMPLDVAFFVAGVPLVLAALASRPRPWELVALAGLAVMTIQSGRNAVWLVVFAAVPAARFVTGQARVADPAAAARHRGACCDARRAGRGRSRPRAVTPPGAGERYAHAPRWRRAARRSSPTTSTPRRSPSTAVSCGSRIRWMPSICAINGAISTGSRGASRVTRCPRPSPPCSSRPRPLRLFASPVETAGAWPRGTSGQCSSFAPAARAAGIVRRDGGGDRQGVRPLHRRRHGGARLRRDRRAPRARDGRAPGQSGHGRRGRRRPCGRVGSGRARRSVGQDSRHRALAPPARAGRRDRREPRRARASSSRGTSARRSRR